MHMEYMEQMPSLESIKSLINHLSLPLLILLGLAITIGINKHNIKEREKAKRIDGYQINNLSAKEYNRKRAKFYFLSGVILTILLPVSYYFLKVYFRELFENAYYRGSILVLGPIVVLLLLKLSIEAYFTDE